MGNKYTEKLAKLIIALIYISIAFFALRFFGSIVGYIILALFVALLGKPLMYLLRKIRIKGHAAPDSVLAALSIILILMIICGIFTVLIPVIRNVAVNISTLSNEASLENISFYLSNLNEILIDTFQLDQEFKLEVMLMDQLSSIFSFNLFSNMIGTVAATFANIGVGLFSVVFIAFFFIKDDTLFTRIMTAITPDRVSAHLAGTISESSHLLSRYFIGLIIEMSCVWLIDFIGLWGVAKLDFEFALGIGFMAGLLNVIPYIGPLIGGVLGTFMGVAIRFGGINPTGLNVSLWVFILILASIFAIAQLVDNAVLQPLIYSTSIQAHPLEIFIVLLIAGAIGGIVGMLLAIPAYTVIRVIVINFFPDSKIVKALSGK